MRMLERIISIKRNEGKTNKTRTGSLYLNVNMHIVRISNLVGVALLVYTVWTTMKTDRRTFTYAPLLWYHQKSNKYMKNWFDLNQSVLSTQHTHTIRIRLHWRSILCDFRATENEHVTFAQLFTKPYAICLINKLYWFDMHFLFVSIPRLCMMFV